MRRLLLVAAREYVAAVRTKAFVVSLVIMPIFMGGSIVAMKMLEKQVDVTDRHIAVIDRTGAVAPLLEQAAARRNQTEVFDPKDHRRVAPSYLLQRVDARAGSDKQQRLELSDKVRGGELTAFLEIGPQVLNPGKDSQAARVVYYARNPAFDDARGWLMQQVNDAVRGLRLKAVHLDPAVIARATQWVQVDAAGLLDRDKSGAIQEGENKNEGLALAVPGLMAMLMFMVIMMGATPLINSVIEEKMYRIAEVLLGAVTPFQLMMGKLVGALGVSLTILAAYAACGAYAAHSLGVAKSVPFGLIPWMIVYALAAVFMFGAMFTAVGSACNDLKEAQSAMMPVWLLVVIPTFVWFPVMKEPLSSFSTLASLIPPFTPMLMLLRQATAAGIPAWQPWVGLLGITLWTLASVWTAGRIFRVGLLLQGKPPKLGDFVRWAVRG
jgi:ABC-2 type transport system permease protein